MRKIAANFIFPVSSPPIKNGLIILDESRTIIDIVDKENKFGEEASLEFYNGILVPGFVVSSHGFSLDAITYQPALDNMNSFLKRNEELSFQEVLSTQTLKKAEFFHCDSKFGSFEIGKSPGVMLIYPFDFQKFTITEESKIKRLV